MIQRFAGALATGLLLASCQARPPRLPAPPSPISPDVRARFLTGGSVDAAREAVPLLGKPSKSDADRPVEPLELEDVLASSERHFPLILAALTEIESAEARLIQARGGFDTRLKSKGKFDAEGFYESERFDVGLEQPTPFWGATFSTGYRLGTGDFAVYDGEAKTNEDGEFRIGATLPLLQGRNIDPSRVAVWQALIGRERAEPLVAEKRLETTRKAADAYWKWLSAGRRRSIALQIFSLAEDRQEQIELAVDEGLLAPIAIADNRRTIVERQSNLILAERRLQQTAIELSLYWRDADGLPLVPSEANLPAGFPSPRDPEAVLLPDDEELALARRPEIRALQLELSSLGLDQDLASNALLPALDVGVFASQDVGDAVNSPDDKEPFEVELGFTLEVPLQRRVARGKLQEIEAKTTKLMRELQFTQELVVADVNDSVSALTQSWQRLEQARENVRLADQLAEAERVQLQAGESDLFRVNVREQQAAFAAAALVDVQTEYFRALARYYTVLGIAY